MSTRPSRDRAFGGGATICYTSPMSTSSPRSYHRLHPILGGCVLAIAGWSGGSYLNSYQPQYRPQFVVRPVGAEVVTVEGAALVAENLRLGRFSIDEAGATLEIRQPGAPPTRLQVKEPRGMTTFFAPPPRATLAVAVRDDKDAEITLLVLPEKTELPTAQGQARLEPGRHELMVQAEGYLPQRLRVDLKPGERQEQQLALRKLPSVPTVSRPMPSLPSAPPASSALPPRPAAPPQPSYSAPRPRYTPPPAAPPVSRPAPVPLPRFTPVAPPPEPMRPAPVPMFTPIGN